MILVQVRARCLNNARAEPADETSTNERDDKEEVRRERRAGRAASRLADLSEL